MRALRGGGADARRCGARPPGDRPGAGGRRRDTSSGDAAGARPAPGAGGWLSTAWRLPGRLGDPSSPTRTSQKWGPRSRGPDIARHVPARCASTLRTRTNSPDCDGSFPSGPTTARGWNDVFARSKGFSLSVDRAFTGSGRQAPGRAAPPDGRLELAGDDPPGAADALPAVLALELHRAPGGAAGRSRPAIRTWTRAVPGPLEAELEHLEHRTARCARSARRRAPRRNRRSSRRRRARCGSSRAAPASRKVAIALKRRLREAAVEVRGAPVELDHGAGRRTTSTPKLGSAGTAAGAAAEPRAAAGAGAAAGRRARRRAPRRSSEPRASSRPRSARPQLRSGPRAPPAPPRAARPARGRASRRRSRARARGRSATLVGSPPCSPQMPSLRPGRACAGPAPTPIAHQLADALLVDRDERVVGEDAASRRRRAGTCPASSRESAKVIWVRSLVPNEKKSA